MPGIHTIFDKNAGLDNFSINCLNETLHDESFHLKVIVKTPECFSAFSYNKSYPHTNIDYENINIFLEGIVYNFSYNRLENILKEIAKKFIEDSDYRSLVKQFVEMADGDFIVQIFDKSEKKLLIFNDYFGRMSIYYYYLNGLSVLSREIKIILKIIPTISIDKTSIAEFLIFEYPLDNRTIFENIYRLHPSQMIIIDEKKNNKVFTIDYSTNFNCIIKNSFPNKKSSIEYFRESFLEATKNRVNTLIDRNYKIIADLSGGYDSRTILGGLNKFTKDVSYFTFEYTHDESDFAHSIFSNLGSPGNYTKIKFNNNFTFQNIEDLIYKTDGLVNYHTTFICYKDVEEMKKNIPVKCARFSGLGGEFLRHPFKKYYKSLTHGFRNNLYSNLPLKIACKAINLNLNSYEKQFQIYIESWREKKPEDQLKKFYYEYYNHLVGIAAEDRERIHFWTVQPMWSLEVMKAVFTQLPLHWVGYKFYIDFMKSVDCRLAKAPIYNSNINLESKRSINAFDCKDRINILKSTFKARFPKLRNVYHKIRGYQIFENNTNKILNDKINHFYSKLYTTKDLFNINFITNDFTRLPSPFPERILTLIIYLSEVEKRYKMKF